MHAKTIAELMHIAARAGVGGVAPPSGAESLDH